MIKNRRKKNVYKKILSELIAIFLILMMGIGTLNIPATKAELTDTENSNGNTINVGILDFSISPLNDFASSPMQKGEATSTTISLTNNGNLGFQYTASTSIMAGDTDLCNQLTIQAEINGTPVFVGPLSELYVVMGSYLDPSLWNLNITLSSGADNTIQNKTCNSQLVFDGWQEGLSPLQGFRNIEYKNISISSGTWTPLENVNQSMSPISDSYVRQDRATTNYGSSAVMNVRSRTGNRNMRSLIRFDFHLPFGVTVNSSNLKLYMSVAPGASRNYEIRKVSETWTENSVNWNNQPTAVSTPIDTVTTGTIDNVWKSWNLTNEIQGIINGAPNYGWIIQDNIENSSASRSASFESRESAGVELRPVLEVDFFAPPAATNHLVINEIYYDVDPSKGVETRDEWVEIYNPTDSAISLSGWRLCDNNGCDTLGSYLIDARGFAVIIPNNSNYDAYWTLPLGAIKIVLPNNNIGGNGLADTGDRVYIQDPSNTTIDAMSFGADTTQLNPAVPLSGIGKSLARIIKGYDFDASTDWIINSTPNPGTNPGSDGKEIMRFTDLGVEVAPSEIGLRPLQGINMSFVPERSVEEDSYEDEDVLEAVLVEKFEQCTGAVTENATENIYPEIKVLEKSGAYASTTTNDIALSVAGSATTTENITTTEELILKDEKATTTTEKVITAEEFVFKEEEEAVVEPEVVLPEEDAEAPAEPIVVVTEEAVATPESETITTEDNE